MEETYNSELLITQEITQPTIETLAPRQEAQETQKHEEKKMSEIDLSKFSLEELQAALEKKKAEEAKTKFELDENDPSNLAKFLQQDKMLSCHMAMGGYMADKSIAKYPGKLTKFAYLKDEDRKPTTDKEKVHYIHIVSVDGEYVVDEWVSNCSFESFPIILEKV